MVSLSGLGLGSHLGDRVGLTTLLILQNQPSDLQPQTPSSSLPVHPRWGPQLPLFTALWLPSCLFSQRPVEFLGFPSKRCIGWVAQVLPALCPPQSFASSVYYQWSSRHYWLKKIPFWQVGSVWHRWPRGSKQNPGGFFEMPVLHASLASVATSLTCLLSGAVWLVSIPVTKAYCRAVVLKLICLGHLAPFKAHPQPLGSRTNVKGPCCRGAAYQLQLPERARSKHGARDSRCDFTESFSSSNHLKYF